MTSGGWPKTRYKDRDQQGMPTEAFAHWPTSLSKHFGCFGAGALLALCNAAVGELTLPRVQALCESSVLLESLAHAVTGNAQYVREGGIGERNVDVWGTAPGMFVTQ